MSLKLLSVNIERSRHLDLVEQFLASNPADVVCIQELAQEDVERISKALGGAPCIFEFMGLRPDEAPAVTMGIGIFTRLPVAETGAHYYVGEKGRTLESNSADASTFNNFNRMVLFADVEKDGDVYRIATTHFTWTPDGQAHDEQRKDFAAMGDALKEMGEFVLCGDFNAPRGREIFDTLAARYKDNIPSRYTSSIDGAIHRAGPLELMVDGVFSTPAYTVSDVELHTGVSDHCAVTALVSKTA